MSAPILGKGEAIAISAADIAHLADSLGCHPADLEAIAQVESGGFGWFRDGRIKILFEKHWFYKYLEGTIRANAVKAGLARASWVSPKQGGYNDQASEGDRYALLEKAIKINREGAFKSISIGTYQIMGFNHRVCGYMTAEDMFHAFCKSEANQLAAFASFLKSKSLVSAIQRRDFAAVERGYNGGGLNGAYAARMKAESGKLRAGKWKDYKPGSMGKPHAPAPTAPPVPIDAEPAPAAKPTLVSAIIGMLAKLFGGK